MNFDVSCSLQIDSPELGQVAGTVDQLIAFLRDQGVQDARFLDEFRLAASEAMNNAIEHGSANVTEPMVRIGLTLGSDEVRLEVADRSVGKERADCPTTRFPRVGGGGF
jgi:anti-sigma regulatory factor (Ser/Thr protein kinase)